MSDVHGVLVVDKPAGITSHDVVAHVRKVFKTRKVGHGGTLDPDATGVLVLGLGVATRFLQYTQAGPKRYDATARFGITTDTQDASGTVLVEATPDFSEQQLRAALQAFTGDIEQIPPMTSAVKVGGERLYRKARRGEEVERPARSVTIHALELTRFEPPEADLDITCSGGTYIRTLINDIGEALGCGAHMKTLRRTEAGGFSLEVAVPLEEVDASHLGPPSEAVAALARVTPDPEHAGGVKHGRPLPDDTDRTEGERVAVFADGKLLAVYRREGDRLVADRVMPE